MPASTNNTPTQLTVFAYEDPSTTFASSFQIYSELDTTNQPVSNTTARINDYSQEYSLTVSGLQDKLIYEVYVTFENDWPEYTSLMSNSEVARLELKTLKKRSKFLFAKK